MKRIMLFFSLVTLLMFHIRTAIQAAPTESPAIPLTPKHLSEPLYLNGRLHATALPIPITQRRALHDGSLLYEEHCSSCHGADLRGSPGAPSLKQAGGATVDFYLTTGRMPLAVKANDKDPHAPFDAIMASGVQANHQRPFFNTEEITALDTYITARSEAQIIVYAPNLTHASLQRGRSLFEENCEACHGAGAQGATVGYQWNAPPLDQATPLQIAQAIRIGPGVMPRFTAAQLPAHDIADVAKYIVYLQSAPQTFGGGTLGFLGPTAEGGIAAVVGVGTLIAMIFWIGTTAARRRSIDEENHAERGQ